MSVTSGSIDVAAVRANFPIEQVVRCAGVELRPSGRGLTGCCPFHDDSTPSLSVAAIPDRFTCFGCGAHGDVIDFVQRLHGLSFVEAVRSLTTGSTLPPVADRDGIPDVRPHTRRPSPPPRPEASRSTPSPGGTSAPSSPSHSPTATCATTAASTSTPFGPSIPTPDLPGTPGTGGPPSPTSCDATG